MRIGIDCRLWNESGVGRYTRNLIEQLQIIDRENKYVLFVGRKEREGILNQVQNDNFRIVNADIRWHTIEEQLRFPEILNRESLDLVHFPYFSVPVFYNKPYVVTIHDLILHHFPTGQASNLPIYFYKLKLFGYKFVIKRAAQNAKKIITVSSATKGEIIDHLGVPKDKVVVTYEGVFTNSKLKTQNSKAQVKTQKYFLFVGNAYPHKNLERLIEAFSVVYFEAVPKRHSGESRSAGRLQNLSRFPHDVKRFWTSQNDEKNANANDISLILVGKEDYFYKRLKEKVKKMHLEKSVLFYGEVSDEELSNLYKNAIALVMPSLMEGFGLPGLEAMANKCLVLASDIPSLQEVYGNAAMYFNPYDTEDLARKMNVILASEERARPGSLTAVTKEILDTARMTKRDMIEKGLERVKFFSWEKMAKETLRIYDSSVRSESW